MIDLLIMMAALVAAIGWTVYLQRVLSKTYKRLEKVEQRLLSARVTLAATKKTNELLSNEVDFLKQVLFDVAKGEAHVWIGEDGLVRATRTADGETPVH
jgi:cell division protein FtsB